MAPEATKMAVRCNMHMDIRVIEDLDFKSQVKFHIQGYQGHMEFTIASEVTTKAARDIMHMDTRVEYIAGFKSEAVYCTVHRRFYRAIALLFLSIEL